MNLALSLIFCRQYYLRGPVKIHIFSERTLYINTSLYFKDELYKVRPKTIRFIFLVISNAAWVKSFVLQVTALFRWMRKTFLQR